VLRTVLYKLSKIHDIHTNGVNLSLMCVCVLALRQSPAVRKAVQKDVDEAAG